MIFVFSYVPDSLLYLFDVDIPYVYFTSLAFAASEDRAYIDFDILHTYYFENTNLTNRISRSRIR